jgi:glycosyltransferase involved in cell wall biosynthesis
LAGALNAGLAAAVPGGDIIALSSNLEIREKDWVGRMEECARSEMNAGIVGCRLARADGTLLHAGAYVLADDYWPQRIGSGEKNIGQYPAKHPVEGISFDCAYLRREALDAIGRFSEDLQSPFADADYCLRARERGFSILLCGTVTVLQGNGIAVDRDFDQDLRRFQESRYRFRDRWHALLGRRYANELYWQSIVTSPIGYAVTCREILKALDRQGVRLVYRYLYGRGTQIPTEEPREENDHLIRVIRSRQDSPTPGVAVAYGQGDAFQRNRGRFKIGFTMLEVDGFPAEWVRQANAMDEVWVPSEFNRRGFLESGLRRPIYRIPLGVDTEHFHPGILGYPNPRGDYVFLSSFEWSERKEPWLLLQAFNDTFRAREPVRLVCKVTNRNSGIDVGEEIRRLELKESGGQICFIFNHEFPYSQLGSLYRSVDCYVSAGRGEGWDMPLMEAMACGLPSIATDWGGHTEHAHAGICYPLRIRNTVPASDQSPYYRGFRWADPDPDHLRHLLRDIYENREEAKRRGVAAAREMAEKWTWNHTSSQIVQRLVAVGA